MSVELKQLRSEVLQAVEAVFERYQSTGELPAVPTRALTIRQLEAFDERWTYQWPKEQETFEGGTRYYVSWSSGEAQVLVAWSKRHAWGRERGRIVIFGKSASSTASTLYPWAEFVETDDGRYAARISDPSAPRSMLNDGSPIPAELDGATILRADECFASVKNGPSLRLVLDRNEEEAMIRHAHWMAHLRRAIS